jgi:hypothetical protein
MEGTSLAPLLDNPKFYLEKNCFLADKRPGWWEELYTQSGTVGAL